MMSHNLNSKWVLYFHDKNNKDWSLKSYEVKYSFSTVEEMWSLFNSMHSVSQDMFFLMRDGHPPLWEDPMNINGGALSFKIYNKNVDTFWLTACLLMVGETICDDSTQIVGISGSPKLKNQTVRIWYKDATKLESIEKTLNQELLKLSDSYIVRHHSEH